MNDKHVDAAAENLLIALECSQANPTPKDFYKKLISSRNSKQLVKDFYLVFDN